jgi:hypothetical protein
VDSSRSRRTWPTLLAVAGLLMAIACGATPTDNTSSAPALGTRAVSLSPLPEPTPSEPDSTVYSPPPVRVRETAERFTFAFLTYDTRTEKVQTFLEHVRPFSTPAVVRALSRSPRSRLPWSVMRSRSERASLAISGTSIRSTENLSSPETRHTVHVNGVITTRTDLAKLRSPLQLRLHIAKTQEGWKVTDVRGGGA